MFLIPIGTAHRGDRPSNLGNRGCNVATPVCLSLCKSCYSILPVQNLTSVHYKPHFSGAFRYVFIFFPISKLDYLKMTTPTRPLLYLPKSVSSPAALTTLILLFRLHFAGWDLHNMTSEPYCGQFVSISHRSTRNLSGGKLTKIPKPMGVLLKCSDNSSR